MLGEVRVFVHQRSRKGWRSSTSADTKKKSLFLPLTLPPSLPPSLSLCLPLSPSVSLSVSLSPLVCTCLDSVKGRRNSRKRDGLRRRHEQDQQQPEC
eukprot:278193-Hanusia_phi.AAC.1